MTVQKRLTRRQRPPAEVPRREDVERQLAWAAQAEAFQHRDPLWHVTESFQQTFDAMGRRHAQELLREGQDGRTASGYREAADGQTAWDGRTEADGRVDGAAARRETAPPDRETADRLRPAMAKFSETAFQRGVLAGAVLQGTGKMMLTTCLKRTLYQQEPIRQRQTLFRGGAKSRVVPGASPDRVIFHRGFAQGAVGLVVDALSDARAVVDTMAQLAQGDLGDDNGAETLRRVYPFLDDSRERALLDGYRAQLSRAGNGPERSVLQNAVVHAEALRNRKAQMKQEFISKLRWISDRASEALAQLEEPETVEQLTAALARGQELPPPMPPPDDGDGQEEGGSSDANPTDRPPDGPEPPDGADGAD